MKKKINCIFSEKPDLSFNEVEFPLHIEKHQEICYEVVDHTGALVERFTAIKEEGHSPRIAKSFAHNLICSYNKMKKKGVDVE